MLKKEDFENPFDWVLYKVNGIKPEQKTELINHRLPTEQCENSINYYRNKNGRYTVNFKNTHICTCAEKDIPEVQKYFDNHYNGNNLKDVSNKLKRTYNEKIRRKGIKGKKPRLKTYRHNNVTFESKPSGRLQVRVRNNNRIHTVCQCYPEEKDIVRRRYDELKGTYGLDEIKVLMKREFNLRRINGYGSDDVNSIIIRDDGVCYRNGKRIEVDESVYSFVRWYIGDKG